MKWFFPEQKKVHCVGIGGVGMSALAWYLNDLGWKVSGSDISDFRMRTRLEEKGIKVYLHHDEKHVRQASMLIYSSAIPDQHPELLQAREMNIPVFERMEAIKDLLKTKKLIGISGSYGKSTTTTFVASMMQNAGLEPNWLIGADLLKYPPALVSDASYLVLECDESKKHFLSLQPFVAIISNVGKDHLQEYHGSMKELADTLMSFASKVPEEGLIVINGDDPLLFRFKDYIKDRKIITCGSTLLSDYRFSELQPRWEGQHYSTRFTLHDPSNEARKVQIPMPGWQNVLDAVMAWAATSYLCPTAKLDDLFFSQLPSLDRRLEFKGSYQQTLVFDDEGDSPDVIRLALQTLRNYFPDKALIPIIQPHRYSRLSFLFDDYAKVLSEEADGILLMPVYSAGETGTQGLTSEDLAHKIISLGFAGSLYLAENHQDAIKKASSGIGEKKIFVTLGPGDVWRVADGLSVILSSLS